MGATPQAGSGSADPRPPRPRPPEWTCTPSSPTSPPRNYWHSRHPRRRRPNAGASSSVPRSRASAPTGTPCARRSRGRVVSRDCVATMQGGITDALIQAAKGTPPASRELRQGAGAVPARAAQSRTALRPARPATRRQPLRDQPPEAGRFRAVDEVRDRVGELADWVDCATCPSRFGHLGLKAFWDHLQHHEVERERVVELFLKSFWSPGSTRCSRATRS